MSFRSLSLLVNLSFYVAKNVSLSFEKHSLVKCKIWLLFLSFSGYGNGDVYADYKYGDSFYIRLIKLSDSGFSNIDQLERHYIDLYGAEDNGYNKNKGNDI